MKLIEHRRRRLNFKLVLVLGLVLGLIVVAVRWTHDYQIKRSARTLLDRGMAARKNNNHRRAVTELGRYIGLVSDDTDGLIAYVDSLRQVGSTRELDEQVFALNEVVLRRRPYDMAIRRVQAELALELGRIPDAGSHLDTIESRETLDAPLWYIRAECFARSQETDRAIEACHATLKLDPNHAEAVALLVDLLADRKNDDIGADAILNQFVKRTNNVQSLLLRATRYARANKPELALEDLKAAGRQAPDDSVVVSALASAVHNRLSRQPMDEANRKLLDDVSEMTRQRVSKDPENAPLRLYHARLLWLSRAKREEAISVLAEGLELQPSDSLLRFSLADALISIENLAEARDVMADLDDDTESESQRQLLQARLLMATQKWEEALLPLQELIGTVPRDSQLLPRARLLEANCYREVASLDAALNAYEAAPQTAIESRLGLAEVRLKSGELVAAINEYRRLKGVVGVNAFLADLLIEYNTLNKTQDDGWQEVEQLVTTPGGIVDSVEQSILRADMNFARGRTEAAWTALTEALSTHQSSPEARVAVDHATGLLLTDVANQLGKGRFEPTTSRTFRMVLNHWAARSDVGRLRDYMNRYVARADPGDTPPENRRSATVVLASEIARELAVPNPNESQLFQGYAEQQSEALLAAIPGTLAQRVQFLAGNDRSDEVLSLLEENKSDPEAFSTALVRVTPAYHSDQQKLRSLLQLVRQRPERHPSLGHAEGVLLSALGDHKVAIAKWRSALKQQPDHIDTRISLAREIAVFENAWQEPKELLDSLTENSDSDRSGDLLDARACAYIAAGDFENAQKTLKAAITRSANISYLVHLSYVQANLGESGSAQMTLNRVSQSGLSIEHLQPLDRVIFDRLKELFASRQEP